MKDNTRYTIDIEIRDGKVVEMDITKGIYDKCNYVMDEVTDPIGLHELLGEIGEYFKFEGVRW